jgi:hypothetical protein
MSDGIDYQQLKKGARNLSEALGALAEGEDLSGSPGAEDVLFAARNLSRIADQIPDHPGPSSTNLAASEEPAGGKTFLAALPGGFRTFLKCEINKMLPEVEDHAFNLIYNPEKQNALALRDSMLAMKQAIDEADTVERATAEAKTELFFKSQPLSNGASTPAPASNHHTPTSGLC